MIDLHSHTNESDGTLAPAELIEEARRRGLHVLGITDHDTFHGYDRAVPHSLVARLRELGFEIALEEAEARGRGMTGRPSRSSPKE